MKKKNKGRVPAAAHPWKRYEQLPLGISPATPARPDQPAPEADDRYTRAEFEADQFGQTGADLARGTGARRR